MAVHAGEMNYDDHGVTGASINLAFRLLDSGPLKAALADSPGVLALVTSSWFFDEVVHHSTISDPATYRPIRVAVKETRTVGWVCLPDHPYPAVSECPYPGLAAFGREQSRWFFGRAQLTHQLITRLEERLHTGGSVSVVAPSGAGKSSLLQAGLLPQFDANVFAGSEEWPQVVVTPTAHPIAVLTAHLATNLDVPSGRVTDAIAAGPRACVGLVREELWNRRGREDATVAARLIVIVDQLEELFTQCTDEEERRHFLDVVSQIGATGPDGRPPVGVVVYGLRADFYAPCANYPQLRDTLQDGQVLVGPMSEEELRAAILLPAEDVGLRFEPGLVELLLRDLGAPDDVGAGGIGGYEAGRLPLLAHTLRAIWAERNQHTLTVDGYRATGGIHHAIARTADHVFAALNPDGRHIARQLLLRMIQIGDGTEDTRRRVNRNQLVNESADPKTTEQVLDALARARLVTLGEATAEITHEALLRAWPRLRTWLDTDRAGRRTHQALEEAAAAWAHGNRDNSLLYQGSRLEVAHTWASTSAPDELSPIAQAFLAASTRQRRRRTQVRTTIIATLVVLALMASTAAVIAFQQRLEARNQRDLAIYNRVVAEADRLASTDGSLSAQLGLVAHRMRPSDETYTRLITAGHAALSTPLTGHTEGVTSVAFSPHGHILASGSRDRSLRLWDVSDPFRPTLLGRPLTGHTESVDSVAISPDGHTLASASDDRSIRLWNITDPTNPTSLGQALTGHTIDITSVAFSPDGRTLASAAVDRSVRLWNISNPSDPTPLGQPLTGHSNAVYAVAFSPDGHTLASASVDHSLRLWTLPQTQLTGHTAAVASVAFSPDGHTLATASLDRSIRLWQVSNATTPTSLGQPLTGHSNAVYAVAFSPGGHTLASASRDGSVRLWNVSDPINPTPLGQPLIGHTGGAISVAFSPDGRTLAAGSQDQSVRLWNISDPTHPELLGGPLSGHANLVPSTVAIFNPTDANILATIGADQSVRLWNISDLTKPAALGQSLTGHSNVIRSIAFSPDGRTLASASQDQSVRLWNVTDPTKPAALGPPLTGHTNGVLSLAFSPDGHTLASASVDRSIQLWNITDPTHSAPRGRPLTGPTDALYAVAFSPNGRTLVSVSRDQSVRLWNLDVDHVIREICAATRNTLTINEWRQYVDDEVPYSPPCQ